jgi:hypothetical protein
MAEQNVAGRQSGKHGAFTQRHRRNRGPFRARSCARASEAFAGALARWGAWRRIGRRFLARDRARASRRRGGGDGFRFGLGGAVRRGLAALEGGVARQRGFLRARDGRSLWAGACRAWTRLWPARLRSHARCASLAVDDGRGAQERRAGGRGRRNVEFGAPLWPRRFAPSAACGKGGPRAGPAYSWRRFWAGRRHFQRRRNAFRDRGGFQPAS